MTDPVTGKPVGDYSRRLANYDLVYTVISRRSRGLSVGINLNPDRVCNFDCVYCQINRTVPITNPVFDLSRLMEQLEQTLDLIQTGKLFDLPRFRDTPEGLRRFNDIAFSGEGEPTACRLFAQAVHEVSECKRRRGLQEVKLVLLTNATLLHRPEVQAALEELDANQGEVWAKLDAGTQEYYERIDRSSVPLRRVLDNITQTAQVRPVVIQSMFLRLEGQPVPASEVDALADRLIEIGNAGGRIRLIQAYTVARPPADQQVAPLSDAELQGVAARLRERTGLPVEVFGSSGPV